MRWMVGLGFVMGVLAVATLVRLVVAWREQRNRTRLLRELMPDHRANRRRS